MRQTLCLLCPIHFFFNWEAEDKDTIKPVFKVVTEIFNVLKRILQKQKIQTKDFLIITCINRKKSHKKIVTAREPKQTWQC